MKVKKEKITKIVVNSLLAVFFCLILLTALSSYILPFSWKLFVVQSGSMSPKIKTGSIILSVSRGEYRKDDIITYKNSVGVDIKARNATTTHRIVDVKQADDGSLLFFTKGDNNANVDPDPVTPIQIVGKVALIVPLLGYILSFTKTQTGMILIIVIPATLIVYSEVLNIKEEVKELLGKKKEKDEKKADD